MTSLLMLWLVDLLGCLGGIQLMSLRRISRLVLPVSGGVMMGIALFWIGPDMARRIGLLTTIGYGASLLLALIFIDRYCFPICPCCTHHYETGGRAQRTTLLPLALAIFVHNVFDGWTAAIAIEFSGPAGAGLLNGVFFHKVPEAIVFGMMFRTAAVDKVTAMMTVVVTSLGILLGYASQGLMTGPSADFLVVISLSLGSASFLFIGGHTFLRRWRDKGFGPALLSAVAGLTIAIFARSLS